MGFLTWGGGNVRGMLIPGGCGQSFPDFMAFGTRDRERETDDDMSAVEGFFDSVMKY